MQKRKSNPQRPSFNARTEKQQTLYDTIFKHDLTFALGPAGTGKTHVAVMAALELLHKKGNKIILTRPIMESGENLGFLPGTVSEKTAPYFQPLFDIVQQSYGLEWLNNAISQGDIEIAPLAYLRGRTFNQSTLILDEAQNVTSPQMKLFLTRIGQFSRVVVCGDLQQTDLPKRVQSGLVDAYSRLQNVQGVDTVQFTKHDIVRSGFVQRVVEAYEEEAEEWITFRKME